MNVDTWQDRIADIRSRIDLDLEWRTSEELLNLLNALSAMAEEAEVASNESTDPR